MLPTASFCIILIIMNHYSLKCHLLLIGMLGILALPRPANADSASPSQTTQLAASSSTAPKERFPLIVETRYGALKGKTDRDGTIAWLGIPYAAPPVGELRWKAPQPPAPWQGVRKATAFSPKAVQKNALTGGITGSEDCLYLNIWRPGDAATGLPVYVWIHGGGNSTGASNESTSYYGWGLASKARVVFVSINYRLGVFGWLYHPALREGADPESASGNFGTLDIIQALRWIHDNIERFGGDPSRVIIAGESAGAFNVLTLLASPRAQGLFHRAVIESGYRTETTPHSAQAWALDLTTRLSERTGKSLAGLSSSEAASWLRSLPARTIMAALKPETAGMLSFPYPIWDGTVLPAEGFAALADAVNKVPIIIGTNREESKIFMFLQRKNSRDPFYQAYAELASARWKAEGADSIADLLRSAPDQPPVYVYRFDWGRYRTDGQNVLPGSYSRSLGAFHSLEIPFFLGTDSIHGILTALIFTSKNAPGRKDLQSRMVSYVRNLAWTGDPNDSEPESALPAWPAWSLETPSSLVLDADLTKAQISVIPGRTTGETVESMLLQYPEPLQTRLREAMKR